MKKASSTLSTTTNTTKPPEKKKHKISASCFNKCIEWKLTISYTKQKTIFTNSFKTKSFFFQTLDTSILNYLQSKLNKLDPRKHKDKSFLSSFHELSDTQISTQDMNDILNVKFPINNTEFNCMIIDANLGIKDNLRNIFFLEFDLSNTIGKETNKVLRDINNENVEREIFFVLNGTIHNVPLFATDLKFSVEMRKFIKCVQSRLETYKNKLTQLFKSNPNEQITLRNNFFSKVLSNTNLGIEFTKPYYDQQQPYNFMTNFNSVVNSNITLNKIYLEVTIPKTFINQSFTNLSTINKTITNKNEQTGVDELKLDKFGISHKTTTTSSNNNNSNSNSNNKNNILQKSSKKETPIKVPPLNENDFKTLKEKHSYNSPNEMSFLKGLKRNKIHNKGTFIPHPTYFSPEYLNHPTIYGNNNCGNVHNLSGINSTTNSNSIYFSPNYNQYIPFSPSNYSFLGQNYYLRNNHNKQMFPQINPIDFEGIQQGNVLPRKLSENSYDNMHDTTLSSCCYSSRSNYKNNYYNTNNSLINQTNISVRSLGKASYGGGEDYYSRYSGLVNNGYVSPRNLGYYHVDNYYNDMSFNNITEHTSVPTIDKKIMNWKKMNNQNIDNFASNVNINNNTSSSIKDNGIHQNTKKNGIDYSIQEQNKECFITQYENLCNFLIFLRKCTPCIEKKDLEGFKEIKFKDFFKAFTKHSLFGLTIYYFGENSSLLTSTYSPTLSSMEISITNKEIIISILDILIHKKICPSIIKTFFSSNLQDISPENKTKYSYLEYTPFDYLPSLHITLLNFTTLIIEYYENKPPHFRDLFIKQINKIISLFPILNSILLNQLECNSWFSINWTTSKSQNQNSSQTSFITYYQFKYSEESLAKQTKYIEIPIIGILPIKCSHKFYLERISLNKVSKGYDTLILKSSLENVNNLVLTNSSRTSVDVDYYFKNVNLNQTQLMSNM